MSGIVLIVTRAAAKAWDVDPDKLNTSDRSRVVVAARNMAMLTLIDQFLWNAKTAAAAFGKSPKTAVVARGTMESWRISDRAYSKKQAVFDQTLTELLGAS